MKQLREQVEMLVRQWRHGFMTDEELFDKLKELKQEALRHV